MLIDSVCLSVYISKTLPYWFPHYWGNWLGAKEMRCERFERVVGNEQWELGERNKNILNNTTCSWVVELREAVSLSRIFFIGSDKRFFPSLQASRTWPASISWTRPRRTAWTRRCVSSLFSPPFRSPGPALASRPSARRWQAFPWNRGQVSSHGLSSCTVHLCFKCLSVA
jgi:hypothetical protein